MAGIGHGMASGSGSTSARWWQHDDRQGLLPGAVESRKATLVPAFGYKASFTPGYKVRNNGDDLDNLVSIVDGLVQDLRQKRAERKALEGVVYGKRRALALPIDVRPAKRTSIASTADSYIASDEDDSIAGLRSRGDGSSGGRGRRPSRGWASVASTEEEASSHGPRNALKNSSRANKHDMRGWDWPLSNKERRQRDRRMGGAVEDLRSRLAGMTRGQA